MLVVVLVFILLALVWQFILKLIYRQQTYFQTVIFFLPSHTPIYSICFSEAQTSLASKDSTLASKDSTLASKDSTLSAIK